MLAALAAFDYLPGPDRLAARGAPEPEGLLRILDTSGVSTDTRSACGPLDSRAWVSRTGSGDLRRRVLGLRPLVRIRLDGHLRSMVLLGLVMALGY
jgi:hypothetical protein